MNNIIRPTDEASLGKENHIIPIVLKSYPMHNEIQILNFATDLPAVNIKARPNMWSAFPK